MPPTKPLSLRARGDAVRELHANLRSLGLPVPESEVAEGVFGAGTREALLRLQAENNLPLTGVFDAATTDVVVRGLRDRWIRPPVAVDLPGGELAPIDARPPRPPAGALDARVSGRVIVETGVPATGVRVRAYRRDFGGVETLLGDDTTDDSGAYQIRYRSGGESASIEIRAVAPDNTEVALSGTKFGASTQETLNLVAPLSVQPLAPEFTRLMTDLRQRLGSFERVAEARETSDRRDTTLLHEATGWDARLIALAATAVKASKTTGLPADTLYALYRSGLPTDAQQLARVKPASVQAALERAQRAGIVSLDAGQIRERRTAFENYARRAIRTERIEGALSTNGELLARAGLSAQETNAFEEALLEQRSSGGDLWQLARDRGVSEAGVNRLQLQGRLAYLTTNNAELAAALQEQIGSGAPLAQLVDHGLYSGAAWQQRLEQVAGGDEQRLARMVPPAYGGKTTAERVQAYANDMARKMRMSYPTRVVTKMVADDELRLGDRHGEFKASVQKALSNAEKIGFRLGQTPVETFMRENPSVFDGVEESRRAGTKQEIKTLQRLYQITPSDGSMKVLMDRGFKSALDVVKVPYKPFIDYYGKYFPSKEEAALVYKKSQQVSSVTYNFYTLAKQLESAPPVYAISGPADVKAQAQSNLIKAYPTLESLFGSLDYCDCDHCRSVLSPAAYFVDLLQFLDPEDLVWENMLEEWKSTHNGVDYPHTDAITGDPLRPYDVLKLRRPDLPHLQLTCENTKTALPYIDIANEIMEYSVANGALDALAARDTGSATTAELLAEPQYITTQAYDTLRNSAKYPLRLPFDLWLDSVRAFFEHFEVKLSEALNVLRPTDQLFDGAAAYDRAAIWGEALGLSAKERALFTNVTPLGDWHTLYGYNDPGPALTALTSARTLSRRLDVSYRELTDIIRTAFINPQLDALVVLRKLGIEPTDVFRYKAHATYTPMDLAESASFEMKLDDLSNEFDAIDFDARTWLNNAYAVGEFNKILVLADPDAGCSFDLTKVQYADATAATALDFHKINLFVRLWRKLEWSIDEVDRALTAFWPADAIPASAANLEDAFTTALIRLAHLQALDSQVQAGSKSRIKLLALWSDLPTTSATSAKSLYAQLFLNTNMLKTDGVFDHPLGQYLRYFDEVAGEYRPFTYDATQAEDVVNGNVGLQNHLAAVQAAFQLKADDVARILTDNGGSIVTAPLTIGNLSLLYQYALLARALKLKVRELIALKNLTGLNPFTPLGSGPLNVLADDAMFSSALAFVAVATELKAIGIKVEDVEYLLRHQYDPVGKYRDQPEQLLTLVRTLSAGLRRIRAEYTLPADGSAPSDDALQQMLALVLAPDVVQTFVGMWTGTAEFTAVASAIAPPSALDPATYAAEPDITVSYDAVRQEQRLTFRGVLLAPRESELTTDYTGALFAALLASVKAQAKTFFDDHFSAFLAHASFNTLFTPLPGGLTEQQQQNELQSRRLLLAQGFLPYLRDKLSRQLIVQTLTAGGDTDTQLITELVTNPALLQDPGAVAGTPLLAAFAALADAGITATYWPTVNASGGPSGTATVATASSTGAPGGTNSMRFEGYLEVAAPGAYRFFAQLDRQSAEAELRFAHLADPVIVGTAATNNAELSQFIELKQGTPYRFTFEVRNLGGGGARLLVQSAHLPQQSLAELTLYPQSAVDSAARARVLLKKVVQIAATLGLGERDVRYLLTHAADFSGLNLSALPTRAADDTLLGAQALFAPFRRLVGYAQLKRDLDATTDELVDVLEAARRTYPVGTAPATAQADLLLRVSTALANLTRRESATVSAAATQLGFTQQATVTATGVTTVANGFTNERNLRRIWQLLEIVEKLGVTVGQLASWTTPTPTFTTARDLRDTIKARYEPETWQRIAQPIFDRLRQKKRDALAAFLMQREGFERIERLYEYFLIDPGMEPVVQTSRIRLAIGSAQLFIQRCLLNLEPLVEPRMINSEYWRWMNRYRVWEANRKVFLYPENWLEPEFRDDKTHLVQELESMLLEGDVNEDLAEDAFFTYLKKLEALARLDIVTTFLEEKLDPKSNTLHVIGRTYARPYQYYYRTYAQNMWTPWEPVPVDVEGDHVVLVKWRDRMHLLWVTFLDKSQPNATEKASSTGGNKLDQLTVNQIATAVSENAGVAVAGMSKVEAQLNWTELYQGEWTARGSSGFDHPMSVQVLGAFKPNDVFVHVTKEYDESGEEGPVLIHLSGTQLNRAFKLYTKNSPPRTNVTATSPQSSPYVTSGTRVSRYLGSGQFKVQFIQKVVAETGGGTTSTTDIQQILKAGGTYNLVLPANRFEIAQPYLGTLIRPFFYQDETHTFYVEPSVTETTIEQWETWAITTPGSVTVIDDDLFDDLIIIPYVPWDVPPIPDPPIDPYARFSLRDPRDWLINPATLLTFDERLVGAMGGFDFEVQTDIVADAVTPAVLVEVAAGSALENNNVVLTSEVGFGGTNVRSTFGRTSTINIVGSGGLNGQLFDMMGRNGALNGSMNSVPVGGFMG